MAVMSVMIVRRKGEPRSWKTAFTKLMSLKSRSIFVRTNAFSPLFFRANSLRISWKIRFVPINPGSSWMDPLKCCWWRNIVLIQLCILIIYRFLNLSFNLKKSYPFAMAHFSIKILRQINLIKIMSSVNILRIAFS